MVRWQRVLAFFATISQLPATNLANPETLVGSGFNLRIISKLATLLRLEAT